MTSKCLVASCWHLVSNLILCVSSPAHHNCHPVCFFIIITITSKIKNGIVYGFQSLFIIWSFVSNTCSLKNVSLDYIFLQKIFHIMDLNFIVTNIAGPDCMKRSTSLQWILWSWSSDRFLNFYFPSTNKMSSDWISSLADIFIPFLFVVDDNVNVLVLVNEFLFSYHLVLVGKKGRWQ